MIGRLQLGTRRRYGGPSSRSCLALDLGSARTRAWMPNLGLVLDAPTITPTEVGYPVHRGSIVDVAGATRMLDRLVNSRSTPGYRPALVVMTIPVLSAEADRSAALTAVEILQPRTVLTIESVKAAALGAGADFVRPLLVVDLGADLTEVAVLSNGSLVQARRAPLGISDFGSSITVDDLVASIGEMVTDLLREDCGPQVVDALDRGPLLVGGGAMRPAITYRIAKRLSTPIQTAPAPQTVAVRGACGAVLAADRHPSTALHPDRRLDACDVVSTDLSRRHQGP
ncbi:rod shape-determining protein MreB [Kribbella steppae]|uniref:Rod shape-determining protein MreB n=1 Tax=Kribbella steppae TaxID=2512223 RepID=A0A4R2H3C1_9ACTN|nr:rod shape-determining protein [Kribbella steppae]TCO19656.1 rod shape-determining protein MreB [Kribbella steppae]